MQNYEKTVFKIERERARERARERESERERERERNCRKIKKIFW